MPCEDGTDHAECCALMLCYFQTAPVRYPGGTVTASRTWLRKLGSTSSSQRVPQLKPHATPGKKSDHAADPLSSSCILFFPQKGNFCEQYKCGSPSIFSQYLHREGRVEHNVNLYCNTIRPTSWQQSHHLHSNRKTNISTFARLPSQLSYLLCHY